MAACAVYPTANAIGALLPKTLSTVTAEQASPTSIRLESDIPEEGGASKESIMPSSGAFSKPIAAPYDGASDGGSTLAARLWKTVDVVSVDASGARKLVEKSGAT